MEQPIEPQAIENTVRLKCVREGSRLRVKIISPGYSQHANCQFPKNIRVADQEYLVPAEDVFLANTQGKFFYRVKNSNIKLDAGVQSYANLKVFGDENLSECSICMISVADDPAIVFIIFAPCGHYCCCVGCGKQLKTCPLCRAPIAQLVTRDQLQ